MTSQNNTWKNAKIIKEGIVGAIVDIYEFYADHMGRIINLDNFKIPLNEARA